VRITGQLVEAATGNHLWADKFDSGIVDIFNLQDEITASVVGAIAPVLLNANLETVARTPANSLDAYDQYLRGLSFFRKGGSESFITAQHYFRKAIELEPTFALALSYLAISVQTLMFVHNHPTSDAERAEAIELAERAVQFGSDEPIVLVNAAYILGVGLMRNIKRGTELADRAVVANPNLSSAWNVRGWMSFRSGDFARALSEFAQAMRLNPLDSFANIQTFYGNAATYYLLGQHEEAATWAGKMLLVRPNDLRALIILIPASRRAGRLEEAREATERLHRFHPNLRLSQLREITRVERPEHQAVIDEDIASLGLPE
jgi:adenylate cyclase